MLCTSTALDSQDTVESGLHCRSSSGETERECTRLVLQLIPLGAALAESTRRLLQGGGLTWMIELLRLPRDMPLCERGVLPLRELGVPTSISPALSTRSFSSASLSDDPVTLLCMPGPKGSLLGAAIGFRSTTYTSP